MKIYSYLIGLFALTLLPSVVAEELHVYSVNYENVLGTSFNLKVSAHAVTEAEKAEQLVLTEIDRLAAIYSAYDPKSEFSRWMLCERGIATPVSKELFDVFRLFEQWKGNTKGALSPAAGLAISLWEQGEKDGVFPAQQELSEAIEAMSANHYFLDESQQTITRLTDVPLVMNSFVKSFIIEKATEKAFKESQIEGMVLNIGGDLLVKGTFRDEVHVTDPFHSAENDLPISKIRLENKAVATSGNYRRGFRIGERWFSHIVDPRTAKPVTAIVSATVVSDDAVTAGALATSFTILSPEESKKLADSMGKQTEYLLVTSSGKKIESKGWKALEVNSSVKSRETLPKTGTFRDGKSWDPKFELAISFELNAIEGNTHRPFVAIWVEDEQRKPVRNLALWYNKPKWVPDMRNWYRINSERFKEDVANFASVTGATRSPGKYSIKWDGKDDKGNYVKQGKYTLIIETSKEHGTDEIIRQPLDLKKDPLKLNGKGNVEVSNVLFDFYKKKK